MQRKNTILLSAVVGALIGALVGTFAVRFSGHSPAGMPAFAKDPALLAHWRYLFAIIPWLLFSAYWELAGKNAAAAKSAESRASRGVHVFLANAALILEVVPIRGLGRFLPASYFWLSAGVVVELAGLWIAIWARRALGRNWSGEISIKEGHELIQSGPYRRLRHPIYTGLLIMYVGTALVTGEWLAVVGVAIAGFAYWRKISLEEANLNVAFGADYDAYRRTTWALVPGLF
jgi:protein-S-isoprenylcysteine O-methyltransferase Ste14